MLLTAALSEEKRLIVIEKQMLLFAQILLWMDWP
jgi:hypothetical protein